jgi:methylenetetrahydrofolate--tRNA-(uracil-5-)-methyltransferase
MHRNTFLKSPDLLRADYSTRIRHDLYFAGQMTGVEGYVESAASGLLAGWQAALQAQGVVESQRWEKLPDSHTVIGAMSNYISAGNGREFQPMNANFGIVDLPLQKFKGKAGKIQAIINESLSQIDQLAKLRYNSEIEDNSTGGR